ncbi:SLBB domain-containing protein [Chthoniobacter flavus]|uniref:SLBB domain-containing protein n=1 Tax=Chthoniobacter flavus TaxID=191863 RepID=UPI0010494EC7|nr:SLBB domain-containing protein [Chthoniobacter flavus]
MTSRQFLPATTALITVTYLLAFSTGLAADPTGKSGISFRQPQVDLASTKAGSAAPAATPGADLSANAAKSDMEDLGEKRQTLQGEVRYAKAKLEAAQKQFALQTAAGDLEKAEHLDQEVKDWQARYSAAKAQLDEVDKQLSDVSQGHSVAADEVVVPGENLEVFVNEDPSFNGIYQVRRGGYIIMPQVGRISVAGKSLSAAEASVKRALQSSQLHNASVMIERKQGADIENGPLIYLSGEFHTPGQWHIPSGITPTLVNVILSAGGVTDKADLTRVRVMRIAANKSVVEEVNVDKILQGGGLTSDITLGEGDVITIPAGPSNLVYVTGNVSSPGGFPLKEGERVSAYAAILQRGGFARFADQKRVYVLRALPDGTKAKLPVDISAIKKGQRPDVQLQTNDILVVPEKWFSW